MKRVFFLLWMILLFPMSGKAELKIDVTGAGFEPIPLAVAPFAGDSFEEITQIVRSDLENSGLFRLVNADAFLQELPNIRTLPRFSDWQAINVQALVQGETNNQPDGWIKVSFRLWDVFSGQSMESKEISLPEKEKRRLGHIISDMVYSRITGEKGYFDSKIVYINESGKSARKIKRLAIMDQDGAQHTFLTDGKDLVVTPRFAPNMQKIAYLSFKKGKPRVYLMDVQTGKEEPLGYFSGMTFAPRFSPDSQQLIMSFSENGNSEIYLYDIVKSEKKRLTNHPMIDTSPCFSPDGERIVFSSDRSGSQQLYVMDKNGKNTKRISMGRGTYATPVWSPRGDYIAFTKIQNGQFHIGVMRPDGSRERLIAQGFLVEGPTWAPNGRVLMYFKQNPYTHYGNDGQVGLYTIDLTGYHEKHIPTLGNGSDPAWSPLLH